MLNQYHFCVLWCQWFLVTVVRLKKIKKNGQRERVCFKRFSSSDNEDDKALALTAT